MKTPCDRSTGLLAAIVDLDGTMVDTVGDFQVALARTLADLGFAPVGRDFIALTVGKGSEHLIRSTLAHLGGAAVLYGEAWAAYQQVYAELNGRHAEIYPGVREGLERLRERGRPMACLTNKPGDLARELLRRKGLDGFFVRVAGGDEFERKKPDPLPLLKTCEWLGVSPSATWMVGDSSNDARAARAAGCPVVLLSHGYNHGEPVSGVDAEAYFDRLDQFPAWLQARGL